ncbi:helix-hairpin-helix domain-containing protein [Candidatus Margulisiibacteriota bacterium]
MLLFFQNYRFFIISAIILIIGIAYFILFGTFRNPEEILIDNPVLTAEVNKPLDSLATQNNLIIFHIAGAVNKPGVYRTGKSNFHLYEAVQLVGGLSSDADLSQINLASKISNGQKIAIPFRKKALSPTESPPQQNKRVNINTATSKELTSIPGIGPSMAAKIINYRNSNGQFSSLEQLTKIKGIGPKKLAKIKKLILI